MNILMIILGGNNIANYALIKYFKANRGIKIPKFDKVALVYTENFSKKFADAIKQLINDVEYMDIELKKQSNTNQIRAQILSVLHQFDNIKAIHLNYTGGTKTMSLGAFLAVTEMNNVNNDIQKVYSDISHSSYKLTLFDGTVFPEKGTLSDNIKLSIDEIFRLHGNKKPVYQKQKSKFYHPRFREFLLKKNIEYIQGNKSFFDDYWEKSYKKLKKTDWQNTIKIVFNPSYINNSKELKNLQKFIKGEWLEEYLFCILNKLKTELNLNDIGRNVKNGKDASFEIDVIAMQGYKPFTFSCTTDNTKALIKSKLFEAKYRSEQIGGIKNTPISVSFADLTTVEALKADLIGRKDRAITQIIGLDDLLNEERLKSRLREILKNH